MFLVPVATALGVSVSAVALGAAMALSVTHRAGRSFVSCRSFEHGSRLLIAEQTRGCLVSKEDAEGMKLKVAMPGLGKEHVKVWADQDGLVIEGKGDKDTEFDGDEAPPQYSRHVKLQADAFRMDQIKAEMKDGVLKVTVPKINVEKQHKDVFQVTVE